MSARDEIKSELILLVEGNDHSESGRRSWEENQSGQPGQEVGECVHTGFLMRTGFRPNLNTGEEEATGHLDTLHI